MRVPVRKEVLRFLHKGKKREKKTKGGGLNIYDGGKLGEEGLLSKTKWKFLWVSRGRPKVGGRYSEAGALNVNGGRKNEGSS